MSFSLESFLLGIIAVIPLSCVVMVAVAIVKFVKARRNNE